MTTGSSAGFLLAFMALFDAGDRVGVPQPGYPAYRNILASLGVEPVPMVLREQDRFAPTAALLQATHEASNLNGVLVMSPANPSGTVIVPEALADLCARARSLGLPLISDEIYHGLTYGAPAATALQFEPDAVIINSFSKYHCMTGWRIGWMVVPESLLRAVERLAQNLYISAPTSRRSGRSPRSTRRRSWKPSARAMPATAPSCSTPSPASASARSIRRTGRSTSTRTCRT